MNFKEFLDNKDVEYVYVDNSVFSCKWDSNRDDNQEIRKTINDFLSENNLKDGTRLIDTAAVYGTESVTVNIMNKNNDCFDELGFPKMSQMEYIKKYF